MPATRAAKSALYSIMRNPRTGWMNSRRPIEIEGFTSSYLGLFLLLKTWPEAKFEKSLVHLLLNPFRRRSDARSARSALRTLVTQPDRL